MDSVWIFLSLKRMVLTVAVFKPKVFIIWGLTFAVKNLFTQGSQ